MRTVSELTRRHTSVLCNRVRHGGLFHNATGRRSHSLVGVYFIVGSRCGRLRTSFVRFTASENVINVGNRHDINKFHTSYCGTRAVRNMRTLVRDVGSFRTRRWSRGL